MASPAFIYAFDNLGPDRFVELCGLLLGSRYRGFLLSGPGPDGGLDGELVSSLGELLPDSPSLFLDKVIRPGELTIFQFKHKVTARTGQASARQQLLSQYRSTQSKPGELKRELIKSRRPTTYVLVTNVEVNAKFRETFREICREENEDIANYEILGLDDLQAWVTQDRHLRAQFFPTLFGRPRFNLALRLRTGKTYKAEDHSFPAMYTADKDILCVDVMNIGEAISYLSNIKFKVLIDGQLQYLMPSPLPTGHDPLVNPRLGDPIQPGQSQEFRYFFEMFLSVRRRACSFLLAELMVWDQIDNLYTCEVPESIRQEIFEQENG
jgi:hypothetical protein